MASQPPLLLVDNLLDRINLYPAAVLSAISEVDGHEARYVADYRRDRTWWQPTSDGAPNGAWVGVNLGTTGAGATTAAPDAVFLDRGHNLWGKTVILEGGTDGVTYGTTAFTSIVPALNSAGEFVPGGDPTTGWCVTEEGALYRLFNAPTARQYWRVRVGFVSTFIPVITGAIVGARTQFLGYSTVYDEDRSERTARTEVSDAGYVARARTYAWRTGELGLDAIGAAEYDATMRRLKSRIFDRAQPFVLCMDYGTYPERAWMFEFDGTRWDMAKRRVSRSGRIPFREVGHAIR